MEQVETKVDVLAVMDEAQCDAENTYGHDSQQVVELNAARAAIAELIAKANALLEKHPGHKALLGHRQAQNELRAALARVGGVK